MPHGFHESKLKSNLQPNDTVSGLCGIQHMALNNLHWFKWTKHVSHSHRSLNVLNKFLSGVCLVVNAVKCHNWNAEWQLDFLLLMLISSALCRVLRLPTSVKPRNRSSDFLTRTRWFSPKSSSVKIFHKFYILSSHKHKYLGHYYAQL